ncbi:MAG: ABC transporter permease [Sulfolobales archaeon]
MNIGSRSIKLDLLKVFRETIVRDLFTNKRFVLGFGIFLALTLFALIGSIYAYPDPFAIYSPDGKIIYTCTEELRYQPPSPQHLLGTDNSCRDIFTWLVVGLKNSLWVAAVAAVISTSIAAVLGLLAGYRGGWLDEVINFTSNFLIVVPMFIVLLMVVGYVPPEMRTMMLVALVIGFLGWPAPARVVRSIAMQNKVQDYVDIAKLMKFTPIEIIFKEILPNILSYIFLIYVNAFSSAIFAEVGIGAIGYGPFDAVTLGRAFNAMLNGGAFTLGLWWWFVPLGLVVTFISYSLLQINLGMQHIFNPRLRFTVYGV